MKALCGDAVDLGEGGWRGGPPYPARFRVIFAQIRILSLL